MQRTDNEFFERVDEHIQLSNEQVTNQVNINNVSASFMYGLARYNAWLSARYRDNPEQLAADKEEIMAYFSGEYQKMLNECLNDFVENFDVYIESERFVEDRVY